MSLSIFFWMLQAAAQVVPTTPPSVPPKEPIDALFKFWTDSSDFPHVEGTLVNNTSSTLTAATFHCDKKMADRVRPVLSGDFKFDLDNALPPEMKENFAGQPNMFGDMGQAIRRQNDYPNAHWECHATAAETADGRDLKFNAPAVAEQAATSGAVAVPAVSVPSIASAPSPNASPVVHAVDQASFQPTRSGVVALSPDAAFLRAAQALVAMGAVPSFSDKKNFTMKTDPVPVRLSSDQGDCGRIFGLAYIGDKRTKVSATYQVVIKSVDSNNSVVSLGVGLDGYEDVSSSYKKPLTCSSKGFLEQQFFEKLTSKQP